MNKVIFIFFFLATCVGVSANNLTIELRSDAFFHTSQRFREIYDRVGASYQIELATTCRPCLDIWTNLDWFSKRGHLKGQCGGKSRIELATMSLGLRYVYSFSHTVKAYIGLGGSLSGVYLKNHCCRSHEKLSKRSVGLVAKSGLVYDFSRHWFLDLFVDYFYQPIHFRQRCVDVGGVKTGAGIGFRF